MKLKERTEESNVPIDIIMREPFFSDKERKYTVFNQKEVYIVVTPLKSKNVIEQKCMKYNLSSSTIKAVADFIIPKHQKESESHLNETRLISKPTKTFENAFECGVGHKSKNKEDCSERDLLTVNQKIKISSPKKEQTVTSDFKKNTRLSKLKKTDNQVTTSFHEHQSSSDLSDKSETEKEIRIKAGLAKKTTTRNTKETMAHQRKSTRNTTRKISVISEPETEESENEFHIKQKKARCSAKKNPQKSGIRNEFPVDRVEFDKTKRLLPGSVQDEEWNENELQKLHW